MALSQKLAKLEKIANGLGYRIVPGKENAFVPEDKTITINTRQKLVKRAWNIAHEIGHAMTLSRCIEELGRRALTGADHEWPALESEFRAWRETDKLMRKLKLYSDDYLKYKHSCIRSYYCSAKKS
jgi:hypothetical protein